MQSLLNHLIPNSHLKVTLLAAEDAGNLQALETRPSSLFLFLTSGDLWASTGPGKASEPFLRLP